MKRPPLTGHGTPKESHGAVLLVTHGTTREEGRAIIEGCRAAVQAAFPEAEVRVAFTSDVVRLVLEEKGERIPGPLGGLAALFDAGHAQVVAQPLYVTPGGAHHTLWSVASALNGLAGAHHPFGIEGVLVGRPLLLNAGDYERAAEALRGIFGTPGGDEAVVLVCPHSEGGADPALCQLQMVLDEQAGGRIAIGAVGGFPGTAQVTARLAHIRARKVTLAPLAIVADAHTLIDLAGEDNPQSWKAALEAEGYAVTVDPRGLGTHRAIRDLFVAHLRETAASHGFLQ